MNNFFKKCLTYLVKFLELFEPIMRWLTPYKFSFDDNDPEPILMKDRKKRSADKRKAFIDKWLKKLGIRKKDDDSKDSGDDSESDTSSDNTQAVKEKSVPEDKIDEKEAKELINRGVLGIEILPMPKKMDDDEALKLMLRGDSHVAYYYHDDYCHQLAVRFEPESAFRYYERNDEKRAKMKVLFRPDMQKSGRPYDKTHVIPVGYHGSEDDPRLLVGFDSQINRGGLLEFEKKISKFNRYYTVLWFVNIQKQDDDTAKWHTTVWKDDGDEYASQTFHDKHRFVW